MNQSFGKYQLTRRLGQGGMGEVFLTADGLALKRLLPHLASDPRFLELFFAEVRLSALLHHPNVVAPVDFGQVEGAWYVAMEYVEGVSLRDAGPLQPGLVALIGAQAALGLHHAHTAKERNGRRLNLVHRDVSPHNVLVSTSGVVKLIDFGVAKALAQAAGKAAWQAPEVALGEALASPRSDQFSLGVVLWELLQGRRLFDAESEAVTLQRVEACEVPAPNAPLALQQAVLRALARSPSERFSDCAALASALDDARLELEPPATQQALAAWAAARAKQP